jgi:hypothetical protein
MGTVIEQPNLVIEAGCGKPGFSVTKLQKGYI